MAATVMSGCGSSTPARILVASDTAVINTSVWIPLGIRIVNDRGADVPHARFTIRSDNDRIVVGSGDNINCRDDTDGTLTITAGSARRLIQVRCVLVHRFGPAVEQTLVAGGPPVPFVLAAYDRHGALIRQARLPVEVSNPAVAELKDGLVYPRAAGIATMHTESLGKWGGVIYDVAQEVRSRKWTSVFPIVTERGDTLVAGSLTFSLVSGTSIELLHDGRFRCTGSGDAKVVGVAPDQRAFMQRTIRCSLEGA